MKQAWLSVFLKKAGVVFIASALVATLYLSATCFVAINPASGAAFAYGASPVLGSNTSQSTAEGSALSTKTVKKAPEVGSTPTGKHISIWVWWTLVAVALVSVILYVASLLNRKSN